MAYTVSVILEGGVPWGFRLAGGTEFEEPMTIAKINPNSKASNQGLKVGDFVHKINGTTTSHLGHTEALELIRRANDKLVLELQRGSLPDIHGTVQKQSNQKTNLYKHANYVSDTEGQNEVKSYKPVSFSLKTNDKSQNNRDMSVSQNNTSIFKHSPVAFLNGAKGLSVHSPLSIMTPDSSEASYDMKFYNTYSGKEKQLFSNSMTQEYEPKLKTNNEDYSSSCGTTALDKQAHDDKVARANLPNSFSVDNSNMNTFKSPQLIKKINIGGNNYSDKHEYTKNNFQPASNEDHVDDRSNSLSKATAKWTPTMTSKTTLIMDSSIGPSSRSSLLVKNTPSPPISKNPVGMTHRSNFSPSSPCSVQRNKGLGLFMKQRELHTDDEGDGDFTVLETKSIPISPPVRGKGTPLLRTLSSPGVPQPIATPFAGLQIQKSKPIKMVRLKDLSDGKLHGSSGNVPVSGSEPEDMLFKLPKSVDYANGPSFNRVGSPTIITNPKPGVWSPESKFHLQFKVLQDGNRIGNTTSPVWSPEGSTSPKRDFRPDRVDTSSMNSPVKNDKYQSSFVSSPSRESGGSNLYKSPKNKENSFFQQITKASASSTATTSTASYTSLPTATATITSFPSGNGSISHSVECKTKLPQTQSATVTLLQKGREGQIPRGALYLGTKETFEGDKKHIDTFYAVPAENKTEVRTLEKKAVPKFDDIGPLDDHTGIPTEFRSQVNDKKQKDWYKQMYSSLHKTEKTKELGYGSLDRNSTMYQSLPSRGSKGSWYPAHAKYRSERYRNQPRSIEDYEPGKSSIALKEARLNQIHNPPVERPGQFSRYYESDTEVDIRKKDRSISPASEVASHELYMQIQKGGEIPISGLRYPVHQRKERSYSQSSAEPTSASAFTTSLTLDRKQRDEENARRRQQLNKYTEEQKNKKFKQERRDNEARRHKDVYLDEKFVHDRYWLQLAGVADIDDNSQTQNITSSQRSPITIDRFEEFDTAAQQLKRPQRKVNTQLHGKAKALYTFNAQNKRELSFKKGDIIYILSQLDRNWYEGEKHGLRGIFPVNYVEVLTSLEEAKLTAMEREGEARVKYNFTAQTPVELSLKKGDIVTLIRKVDDNWYEGRFDNRQGIFPIAYTEIDKEPQTPLMTPLVTPLHSLAPTPLPGSPGQLSPGSTISNGTAPTIPTAPQSPRDLDSFDFNEPFDFGLNTPASYSSNTLPTKYGIDNYQASKSQNDYVHNNMPNHASKRSNKCSSLDNHEKENQKPCYNKDPMSHSMNLFATNNGKDTLSWNREIYDARTSSTLDKKDKSYKQPNAVRSVEGSYDTIPNQKITSSLYRDANGANVSSPVMFHSVRQELQKFPIYKAIYTYVPQNADELELREGDRILVMEKCDDGWYVGTSERTKEFGTFPGNYVQLG